MSTHQCIVRTLGQPQARLEQKPIDFPQQGQSSTLREAERIKKDLQDTSYSICVDSNRVKLSNKMTSAEETGKREPEASAVIA